MTITSSLFEAFLKCPVKCWLRASNERPAGNVYAEWVKTQNEFCRVAETNRLVSAMPAPDSTISPPADSLKLAKWRLASQVAVRATVAACGGESKGVPCVAPGAGEMMANAASGSLADGTLPGSSACGSPGSIPKTSPAHIDATAQPAVSPPVCHLETCLHMVERVPDRKSTRLNSSHVSE